MKPQHVVIVGNVGSGKSSVLECLSCDPKRVTVAADELFLVNPFFQLSKQQPQRWCFTNDLWFLFKRVELMEQAFSGQDNRDVIIDSGVLMSYVYGQTHAEMGNINKEEWVFFEACFDRWCGPLVRPDTVVFLTAPFEVLRQRIEQRSRGFEVAGYFDYLKSLEIGLTALEKKLEQIGIPIVKIDTVPYSPPELAQKVLYAIKR